MSEDVFVKKVPKKVGSHCCDPKQKLERERKKKHRDQGNPEDVSSVGNGNSLDMLGMAAKIPRDCGLFRHQSFNSVDGRNPKQPPATYETL